VRGAGLKRAFDIIFALAGLVALAPFLLLISLAIRVSSGPPVFFRQQRVGLLGRDFMLWKFRTMTTLRGAEKGAFEPGSTRRVTGIGRWLRKTKMDELPQLWNVVRGDMSLVGPRPEVRRWVEAYPERWAFVHTVRPGITDPASIRFRSEEDLLASAADPERMYREEILPQKLAIYEEYVRTRTFWGDVKIILSTIAAL
jgi:lipopolysaccharide/colanic/teichoic acid biosynthesis glycosyltransferase